jgi:hypothetical protein
MRYFQKITDGVNVLPLLHTLTRRQDLFNQENVRTTSPGTPFSEQDDILLRYSPPKDAGMKDGYFGSDETIWYPAINHLPEALPLIGGLMSSVGAYELGRVIISRLAPGRKIHPHIDDVGKYVQQGDRGRYHIVLQGHPGSNFYCGNLPNPEGETEAERAGDIEGVNMRCGEVWWFNAHRAHYVINDSAEDRLHLLVDVRLMGGQR